MPVASNQFEYRAPPAPPPAPLPVQASYDVGIFVDGMLWANCRARATGEDEIFVHVNPLHFRKNTPLMVEFRLRNRASGAYTSRLLTHVRRRGLSGLYLGLG